jgi:dihydrolipoamide dehydrogenase
MDGRFDAVIIGGGPGGEVAVNTLLKAGKRVSLIENTVLGGECSNWGCIPSKTLLRPTEIEGEAERAAGVGTPGLEFAGLAAYRDYMVSGHDDTARVARYEERGVTVIKDTGTIAGPGRVTAGGRQLEAGAIVVATGAEAVVPPIPGLADAGYWTNREATDLTEVPASVVTIGGGVVGVELGQFLARFGSRVTIVQGPDRLADREAPELGDALAKILEADGIELQLGARATGVRVEGGDKVVELDGGAEVRGAQILVATGRRPRTSGLGLETVGIEPGRRGIEIDERCRAADGVWAIGDVTGLAPFTHVAKYQARIAVADIVGQPARADYRAVPRVIFTDPEVAAVGLTEADARAQGRDVVACTIDLPSTIARPYTYEEHPAGTFGVVVDRAAHVLVGAFAIAPLAGEWIHAAVLAIRAEIPVSVLKDTIAQFPTFSEALGTALRAIPDGELTQEPSDHCAHPRMTEPVLQVR